MRKGLIAAVVGGTLASVSVAMAVDPSQRAPSAMAYFETSFGGAPVALKDRGFFYGLKIDHDRRFGDAPPPPLLDARFSERGFHSAAFNGLPVAMRVQQVNQAGELITYTVFDYGLAAIAALGIGYVIYEIADAPKRTPDPTPTPTPPPGGGGLPLVGDLPLLGSLPLLGDLTEPVPASGRAVLHRQDREYQQWLDGGTGQMGDLGG